MNRAQALHTAARRYCRDQAAHWGRIYAALGEDARTADGGYTASAMNVFPRYLVLDEIGSEICRLNYDILKDTTETRELLALAGGCALGRSIERIEGVGAQAIQDERDSFIAYIRGLTEDQLGLIDPLPYLYVMNDSETAAVRRRVSAAWGTSNGYWYPLAPRARDDIEAFQDTLVASQRLVSKIRNAMRDRGNARFWRLLEGGEVHAEDIRELDPGYGGEEEICTSESLDWIVYCSHESSITFGGWALELVKEFLPNWREALYTDCYGDSGSR